LPPELDRREEPLNQVSFLNRKVYTAVARLEWAANGIDVVGISGYRGIRSRHQFDFDGSPFDTLREDEVERTKALSQKIRIQSQDEGWGTFDGNFEWLIGGIFYREKTRRTDHLIFGPDSAISSIIRTFEDIGIVAPILLGIDTFDAPFTNDVATTSFAFYGQGK